MTIWSGRLNQPAGRDTKVAPLQKPQRRYAERLENSLVLGLVRTTWVWVVLLVVLSISCTRMDTQSPGMEPKVKTRSTEPWYQRSLVGMEIGPTGAQLGHSDREDLRYSGKFEGREIVRYCLSANCDYLVIWARDGDYAYYDSKLLPKAPGLGKKDALRETIEEAQKHNLPVIAYCVVQQGGHFLKEHPELEMRDCEGNRIGRFCYNSGYLDAMKDIVAEQLAYGIEGFHVDMLDQGFDPPYGCWCEHCRKDGISIFLTT